jgi:serine/threonine-protein kinase HipA
MAAALWGNVYFRDAFAGVLHQEPGGRVVFEYDSGYLESGQPAIAHTLPLRTERFHSDRGLLPFFDNLVAEGWLRDAQARALEVAKEDRFALLLAFGGDCAGAVSIVDPEPTKEPDIAHLEPDLIAALAGRASLSGIQPKLMVVRDEAGYRPVGPGEISSHIAKLPSGHLPAVLEMEWLATQAARALLPGDLIADMELAPVAEVAEQALVIRRFDRTQSRKKLHFEEFNQLLDKRSDDKYDGAYEDMAELIDATPDCLPAEKALLLRHILACVLVGNTDAHFKNFAMMHTPDGLRLTPIYDMVASALLPQYQTLALAIGGAANLSLGALGPKHIVSLAASFGLPEPVLLETVKNLQARLPKARDAVFNSDWVAASIRNQMIEMMEKRWNGTFASIGQLLSKRHAKDAARSS